METAITASFVPTLKRQKRRKNATNAKAGQRRNRAGHNRGQEEQYRHHLWRKRRELRNVIDAELLFQFCYLVHGHVKAVAAKGFAFNALELLAHGVILMLAYQAVQGGEEHRVFARLMRAIHAIEGRQRFV